MGHRQLKLIAVGVAGSLLMACARAPAPVPAPRAVVVESPVPVNAVSAESYPGAVHARVETNLAFRVPGKILRRAVDLGARVKPGDVLATLDPQDARLNLDTARAAVTAAEADRWLADAEEKRYRDLRESGHVGQSMVDTRVNAARLARARLEQARSQLGLAQNQSRYTTLSTDTGGVVTQVMAEPGMVVAAGQTILRLAEDGEREVRTAVPEGRIDSLRTAAQIGVSIYTLPGRLYAGKVRDINPQADPATRTHDVRVTIVDADVAVPLGATASVLLGSVGEGKAFRLPATAVSTIGTEPPSVWVVISSGGAATVQPRPVHVLQYLDAAVIVTGDLKVDDRLVSAGVHLLVPGLAVKPIDRKAPTAL